MFQLSYLERLPSEIMGTLLAHLNRQTGTKEVVNDADLPVIMKYASHLACTSKRMYALVNDHRALDPFFHSLSCRFGEIPAHYAAQFDTVSSRQWLWSYIQKSGDQEAYQEIQEIFALAAAIKKEANESGLIFDYGLSSPEISSYNYQTQQGFFLMIDNVPSLATPFGQIAIFHGGMSMGHSPQSVSEIFIQRLNGQFEELGPGDKTRAIYEIPHSSTGKIREIRPEEVIKIAPEEVEDKRGTQNLITDTLFGVYSYYKIGQIGDKLLPQAALVQGGRRSNELIRTIWKMLEAARLGQNPLSKEREVKRLSEMPPPPFENLSELAEWGIHLVKALFEQPLQKPQRRILPLEHRVQANTLNDLHSAANELLEKQNRLSISQFFEKEYSGIQLCVNDKKIDDLKAIETAYRSVQKGITTNWVRTTLKDHPHILAPYSEEEYHLFFKEKKSFSNEEFLLKNLMQLLNLSKFVHFSRLHNPDASPLYLWIRKDKLDNVVDVFNFQFLSLDSMSY